MDKKKAMQEVADIKEQISNLLRQAEHIADEAGITFSFNPSGEYGAGALYTGANAVDNWARSEYYVDEGEGYWLASSRSC